MGVRGLTMHLLPYAEWKVLGNPAEGQSGSPCHEGRNAVIDGPSLAFFIYRRLLAHKPDGSNIIDSMPNYSMLGRAAVAFLQQLQICGIIIDRIYFDGFLPEYKIDTRQKRLERSITELFDFRTTHPNGFPVLLFRSFTSEINNAIEDSALSLQDILRDTPQSPILRDLPNPPFIVPAVIQALHASEFKCAVELVPGEADPYCAGRASDIRGLIFTADSDLLIHDSGPSGSIVLLDHIQMEAQVENGTTLRAPIFEPCRIAQKLGIGRDVQALQSLAYFLQEVPGISFHQALQKVRSHKYQGVQLAHKAFHLVNATSQALSRYEAALFNDDHPRHFRQHGQHLDPRLAEVCLQIYLKVTPTEHVMYLPVLLEDPARASAWEASVLFRHFAYTYLVHRSNRGSMPSAIYEYRRKGRRMVRFPLCISSLEECKILNEPFVGCGRLKALHKDFDDIHPTILRWRYVAARYVLDWYDSESKSLPSVELVKNSVMGKGQSKWSWDEIHFAAQIEGLLYSIHMVRQVFQYLYFDPSECDPTYNVDGLASSTIGIAQILKELPGYEKLLLSMREIRCLSNSSGYEMPDQKFRKRLFPI